MNARRNFTSSSQVNEEEAPAEDEEGEDGVPSFAEWLLPASQFEGLWDALHFER